MDPLEIRKTIRTLAGSTVSALGFELVAVQLLEGREAPVIRMSVDSPNGVGADDCARISRHVGLLLDEADPVDSAYVLEVSSPGIDRPVQTREDFERFVGFQAKIRLFEGAPRRRYSGTLGALVEDDLTIVVNGDEHLIDLNTVEHAQLVLTLQEFEALRGSGGQHDDQ